MVPISSEEESSILIYFLRRDLRLRDNPVFHALATNPEHKFTYLLPVYVFPAQQVEISGFIPLESNEKSPYPEAKSELGRFWRCGPHRAKFLAESVWALKESLQDVDSGLDIRVGLLQDSLDYLLKGFQKHDNVKVKAVWMTQMMGEDEKTEESECKRACEEAGIDFKLWKDEKYLIDDDDVDKRFNDPELLPDVFTTYRKMVEPLRDNVREVLSTPAKRSLPPLPPSRTIPPQALPFVIPQSHRHLEEAILLPVTQSTGIKNPPPRPEPLNSAHVYHGGEKCAHERIDYLLKSGSMTNYKATRNGLLGLDFSTKLSAWLSMGCLTARQVHADMYAFEEATSTNPEYQNAPGWGEGENEGTKAVRFELAWRDYMRLCHKKFGDRIKHLGGFKQDLSYDWKRPGPANPEIQVKLDRFLNGTTGMGLIDASQRELFHTGYTSNRARQNVASYLAKHLGIDWRIGAEWYENMLIDHDISSNWGNWQYVAGVGNDPRSTSRIFNSVKQAVDYDAKGEYVYHWIPEFHKDRNGKPTLLVEHETREEKKMFREGHLRDEPCKVQAQDVFRGYTIYEEKLHRLGLSNTEWITNPLIKIDYIAGRLITKPGQRERWRNRQEEQEERQKKGKQNKHNGKSNGSGKSDHRHDEGNDKSGRGGPGGSAGGSAGGSSSNSGANNGPSGEDSSSGNGGGHTHGANDFGTQSNQSGNQNGQGEYQHQTHGYSHGRGYSNGYGNHATRTDWHNNPQQRPPRQDYANNRDVPNHQGGGGWVSNGFTGRHHRMIYPPPGLPPRHFSPAQALPACLGPGPGLLPPWGTPTLMSNGHGPPPGMNTFVSPINPQGQSMSPTGPMSPNGYHQGPMSYGPQMPHQFPPYVMSPNGYRNWGNGAAEGQIQYLDMPRTGYTAENGPLDLSRTVGRRHDRMDLRGPASGSWRQPSAL